MSSAHNRPSAHPRTRVARREWLRRSAGVAAAGAVLGDLSQLAAAAQQPVAVSSADIARQGVRRLITGHNARGRSYIVSDERVTGGTFPNLFRTSGGEPLGPGPAGDSREFYASDSPQLEPALGGSSFHFVTLPPMKPDAKPLWHRTWTVDYNIILSGEVVLLLDEGKAVLGPGDVVIQRNTLHAWQNNSPSAPVRWVAVLVPIRRTQS
jgi:quercetin dioxygenase-like cupin family protein